MESFGAQSGLCLRRELESLSNWNFSCARKKRRKAFFAKKKTFLGGRKIYFTPELRSARARLIEDVI
jgi:hypothetical protein